SKPVSRLTAYFRYMASACTGSLPCKKTSFTTFGQSDVGNMPEGSHTLMTETPAGNGQSSAGKFWDATCINAFHNTVDTRGERSLDSRVPAQAATTRDGVYPIVHASSASSVCPTLTAAGLPILNTLEESTRAVSSLNE